ncbi:MAG: hypothetical protein JWM76_3303 [Pseudonocardiales bacterium]|nr:hypothetical protein [Pseudonocardiales bacterium]
MRLINRVLGALLALALAVIGFLLVIEVVTHWFSKKPAIVHWHSSYAWLKRTSWNQGSVRVVCIVLAVVGLILLVAELKRSTVARLAADPDQTDTTGIDTAYTRRGVAAAVRAAVSDVDGVRSAKVGVAKRKVTVNATTSARDRANAQSFKDPITTAAEEKLATLKLRKNPSVSVRVEPRSK